MSQFFGHLPVAVAAALLATPLTTATAVGASPPRAEAAPAAPSSTVPAAPAAGPLCSALIYTICLYPGPVYSGQEYGFLLVNGAACWWIPDTRSVRNDSGRTIVLYDGRTCDGTGRTVNPGGSNRDLGYTAHSLWNTGR